MSSRGVVLLTLVVLAVGLLAGAEKAPAAIYVVQKGTIECHSGRTLAVAPRVQSSGVSWWWPYFYTEENGVGEWTRGQIQFQWPGQGPWLIPSNGVNAGAQDGPRQQRFGTPFRVAVKNYIYDATDGRWYYDYSDGLWFAVNQGNFYTGTVYCNP